MAANFKIKICIVCGKEFKTQHGARQLCSEECQKERQRQIHQRNSQLERDLNQASIEKIALEYRHPSKTLEQINGEARERGMTYGQYMVYLHFH